MKIYVKASFDYQSVIREINELISRKSTNKIARILDDIPVGSRLRVAKDESLSRTTYFDKTESGWEDYPYTYSSLDIADELVRGQFHYVYEIEVYTRVVKPNVSDRYAPPMWRKK